VSVLKQNGTKQEELVRLTAQTDKISMKSALEAKIDLLI
jgi:hypothetical protein